MFDVAAKEAGNRFMECCQETNDAFDKLMAYNTTDGPLFSQIGAISYGFLDLAKKRDSSLADFVVLRKKSENIFTKDNHPDANWEGVPPELIAGARTSWRRFKKMVDALK